LPAIKSSQVDVDDDVTGLEWEVDDIDELAALIAIIALGQAEHAAEIIAHLEPSAPAYTEADLIEDAKAQMLIKGTTDERRLASRQHRDGLLFECISWITARQSGDARTFLKDPHLDPTSHGLDGLILQLATDKAEVIRATICEDKCTKSPRTKFRDDVLTTFGEHHRGQKRARDLVANAVELIRDSGVRGTAAVKAAAKVTDKSVRCYRAALTTKPLVTTARARLFAGYDSLDGIGQDQRIGATLPLTEPLRDWFQRLADAVVDALNEFGKAEEKQGEKRV
jgi:hypothetical protein